MTQKQLLRPSSIRNILTLRYDPEKIIFQKKLNERDFKENNNSVNIVENVESMIKNEIKKQIGSMKNIIVPMGSGIDSTIVLMLAKQILPEKNIHAISLSFNDSQDETKGAEKICSALGVECHKVTIDNVLADLPLQVSIVAEPRWNLWFYYALKEAKKRGAEVILTGDGGDELFAGYVFRYSKYLDLDNRSDNSWTARAWLYLQCHERDWVPDQREMFGTKIDFEWKSILKYLKPYFDNDLPDKLNQVFLADYNGKLTYDWIPTNTILSKHFGIKTVSPILSDTMIEYAPHIPVVQKYDTKTQEGKLVLRKILRKHGILHYVSKKKIGFGMDLVNLWERHGKRMAENYLDHPLVASEGLINKEWLDRSMDDLRKKKDPRYINKILQIVSLEIWFRNSVRKRHSI